MKEQWLRFANWVAARNPRERALLFGAVVAAVGLGGDALFLAPARLQLRAVAERAAQSESQAVALRQQVQLLEADKTDPDADNKARLAKLREDLELTGKRLQALDANLVPPERMAGLLENILVRSRGLRLVSLKTLAAEPVIAPKNAPAKAGEAAAAGTARTNIFKHGVEITIEGTFPDLMAYLAAVEKSPQQVLWGHVRLEVTTHPKGVMTLTVYTLSLDKTWLVV